MWQLFSNNNPRNHELSSKLNLITEPRFFIKAAVMNKLKMRELRD
jgi:hypothetical protein